MSNILSCITGPRLYTGILANQQTGNYNPNILEALPNASLTLTKVFIGVLKWTMLFWMPFFVKKYKTTDGLFSVSRILACAATGYWSLIAMRGFGRWLNPMYTEFIVVLNRAQQAMTTENMEMLSKYNFDFSHWPLQYDAANYKGQRLTKSVPKRPMTVPSILKPLCYTLAHTIGIRMVYPGCTGLINSLVASQRRDRIMHMINTQNVKRMKIRTVDGNDIEALYSDNRQSSDSEGKTLVICCEGNAGYAELGNPKIALDQNYSVIGWNHPGFGGSTGLPFPKAEQHAIDAVMKFALEQLRFKEEDIMIFGWSIGGYTASWAAMNYPSIRGLILDATFDNIDKLAEKSMPFILYPFVLSTVREYLDLNVGDQLVEYPGPVRFIVRGQDEIISTEPENRRSNRGYHLMEKLFRKRYPGLFNKNTRQKLWEFLESNRNESKAILGQTVNQDMAKEVLSQSLVPGIGSGIYPLHMNQQLSEDKKMQILIYLASTYYDLFDATHCTELPSHYLREPWSELLISAGPDPGL